MSGHPSALVQSDGREQTLNGRDERALEVGLFVYFRYALIREAADPALSKAQRGRLVRELASHEHVGPDGRLMRVGRSTIDDWIRAYLAGGFEALCPRPRQSGPVTAPRVLCLAEALKRELPERTAAQVREIMLASGEQTPVLRTLQRHFARVGLNVGADGRAPDCQRPSVSPQLRSSVLPGSRGNLTRRLPQIRT